MSVYRFNSSNYLNLIRDFLTSYFFNFSLVDRTRRQTLRPTARPFSPSSDGGEIYSPGLSLRREFTRGRRL